MSDISSSAVKSTLATSLMADPKMLDKLFSVPPYAHLVPGSDEAETLAKSWRTRITALGQIFTTSLTTFSARQMMFAPHKVRDVNMPPYLLVDRDKNVWDLTSMARLAFALEDTGERGIRRFLRRVATTKWGPVWTRLDELTRMEHYLIETTRPTAEENLLQGHRAASLATAQTWEVMTRFSKAFDVPFDFERSATSNLRLAHMLARFPEEVALDLTRYVSQRDMWNLTKPQAAARFFPLRISVLDLTVDNNLLRIGIKPQRLVVPDGSRLIDGSTRYERTTCPAVTPLNEAPDIGWFRGPTRPALDIGQIGLVYRAGFEFAKAKGLTATTIGDAPTGRSRTATLTE